MYESAQRTLNAAAEAAFLAGLCHSCDPGYTKTYTNSQVAD